MDALEPAEKLLTNSPLKQLYTKCIYAYLGPDSVDDVNDGILIVFVFKLIT